MNILIIEDDETIREGCAGYLNELGYKIFTSESAQKGYQILGENKIHIIVLDIMLPGMNGIEFLSKIRKESQIPVIVLTALSDEQTQIKVFDELADDYLAKPFSLLVLEKRIQTQIRHHYGDKEYWNYGKASVDFKGYIAYYDGEIVNLTAKEFQLLELFIENTGITLTRNQILDNLWEYSEEPYERVIDVYIKNIRKKLKLDCLITVKGIGYKLEIL